MRVNNQSDSTVDWTQSGSNPPGEDAAAAAQSGTLFASQETPEFTPSPEAPYSVDFMNVDKPSQTASSGKFDNPSATVTLNDNWTVTVS